MFDLVTFGEAMLRLSPPEYKRLEQTGSLDIHIGSASGARWHNPETPPIPAGNMTWTLSISWAGEMLLRQGFFPVISRPVMSNRGWITGWCFLP